MNWQVAIALTTLLSQLNNFAPYRNKSSDGPYGGDEAHANRTSDHNPNDEAIVTAFDFTHDPNGGLDCQRLANELVASRDPRIKYIIWNNRIIESSGNSAWQWKSYSGSNPHEQHLHLSVVALLASDNTRWNLPMFSGSAPARQPGGRSSGVGKSGSLPTIRRGSRGDYVAYVQRYLCVNADGIFGQNTEAAVRRYQAQQRLAVDGIVGPNTWQRILSGLGGGSSGSRPTIRRGSRGDDVVLVQRYLGVTADGIFGQNTEAAVRRYQTQQRLAVDGIVGPSTWQRILSGLGR